jgi:hypothetical protein
MSRRSEIIQRANAEYQAAVNRGQELHEEILRQQADVLSHNSAAAKTAMAAYEASIADAFTDYQLALSESEQELVAAELEASSMQSQAEQSALEIWSAARDAADNTRLASRQAAEDAYSAAYFQASRQPGAQKDQAIAGARKRRDDGLQAAEDAFLNATTNAWHRYEESRSGARESAIASIDKARATQAKAAEKAANTHERVQLKSREALQKAIASDPTASAIEEAFRIRLAEADAQTEREKQDIIDRMKADLDNATP